MTFSLEEISPFSAASFLQMNFDLVKSKGFAKAPYKKPYLLASTEELLDEEVFSQVAFCYEEEGLYLAFLVKKPFEEVFFPEVDKGDGIEIFIDTRDLKSVGSLHKFCHHFVFLPKEVGGSAAYEVTKLRLEDSHPLCESKLLHQSVSFSKHQYEIEIFIEAEALFGFDPNNFQRLGFAYRIHRKGGAPQHFNLSSKEYQIEKYPQLWASFKLNK